MGGAAAAGAGAAGTGAGVGAGLSAAGAGAGAAGAAGAGAGAGVAGPAGATGMGGLAGLGNIGMGAGLLTPAGSALLDQVMASTVVPTAGTAVPGTGLAAGGPMQFAGMNMDPTMLGQNPGTLGAQTFQSALANNPMLDPMVNTGPTMGTQGPVGGMPSATENFAIQANPADNIMRQSMTDYMQAGISDPALTEPGSWIGELWSGMGQGIEDQTLGKFKDPKKLGEDLVKNFGKGGGSGTSAEEYPAGPTIGAPTVGMAPSAFNPSAFGMGQMNNNLASILFGPQGALWR